MIDLPFYIRNSSILTDIDKDKLASVVELPSEMEVDEVRTLPNIQDLLNAFIGDDTSRSTHLQLLAKEYLSNKDIAAAWKILLL